MLARQIAVGFGVTIVFPLLIYYGVSTFSPPPKLDDFRTPVVYNPNMSPEERTALQNKQKAESLAYEQAERMFSFRLLCVAAPLGYAASYWGPGGWLLG